MVVLRAHFYFYWGDGKYKTSLRILNTEIAAEMKGRVKRGEALFQLHLKKLEILRSVLKSSLVSPPGTNAKAASRQLILRAEDIETISNDMLDSCDLLSEMISGEQSEWSDLDAIPMHTWYQGVVLVAKCYAEIDTGRYMASVLNPFHEGAPKESSQDARYGTGSAKRNLLFHKALGLLDTLKSCLPPLDLNRMDMVCEKPVTVNNQNFTAFVHKLLADVRRDKLVLTASSQNALEFGFAASSKQPALTQVADNPFAFTGSPLDQQPGEPEFEFPEQTEDQFDLYKSDK